MSDPLLSVRDLVAAYRRRTGLLSRRAAATRVVDGVSFSVERGETLGIVGESGCGKSTLLRTALRIEDPAGGTIRFDGEDVTDARGGALREFRRRTGVVFQDAGGSFDPRMTVAESVAEPLAVQGMGTPETRRERAERLLARVDLSGMGERYPHELSGGQRQRAALARALATDPDLLALDEPTSALDVSVQARLLDLLADLRAELGLASVLVTHDLGVVRAHCDRVLVLYLGEVVERGPAEAVVSDPQHPYTRALVAAIPDPDPSADPPAVTLSGDPPDPDDPPEGCRFHTRCPAVIQPDGVDVEQVTWRALLDFRRDLSAGRIDRATLRERDREGVLADAGVAGVDDGAVNGALSAALDALEREGGDAAAAELRAVVETPCERSHPELRETGADRAAACFLHDPD